MDRLNCDNCTDRGHCPEYVTGSLCAADRDTQGWVDADKQHPKELGRYLVCLKRKGPEDLGGNYTRVMILRWTSEGWRLPHHFPEWINGEIEQQVIYWRGLPPMPADCDDR